ncbi:PEGA domain-containing protein [Chloracidobacterium aggregatum]|uniref:PEGA domain-containing protein n=1 Tax=Chloracidobacterium aggregatum TaxID=2851959 RepID=UPI001B8C5D3C|nr:PEGA domain-containing protein [Chloracidobacterium aggregatum]QUV83825.1 PEGA domain-containing protein [Chloracidobacterium sp. 2]
MTTTYLARRQPGFALTRREKVTRWIAVILGFCLVAALVSAGILLYIRYPSALGKLDVVTTPPGAEIWLDGRRVGTSPCTIERVGFGLHTLRAAHAGFLLAEREILVESGEQPEAVSFVLQPIKADPPPARTSGSAPTERIAEFMQRAAEAFQRGDWVTPANDNALYYADAVLLIQPDNEPARAMRTRVQNALVRQAELAAGRGDLATAQSTYHLLLNRFPSDERSQAGITRIADLIDANRGRPHAFSPWQKQPLRPGAISIRPTTTPTFTSRRSWRMSVGIRRRRPCGRKSAGACKRRPKHGWRKARWNRPLANTGGWHAFSRKTGHCSTAPDNLKGSGWLTGHWRSRPCRCRQSVRRQGLVPKPPEPCAFPLRVWCSPPHVARKVFPWQRKTLPGGVSSAMSLP